MTGLLCRRSSDRDLRRRELSHTLHRRFVGNGSSWPGFRWLIWKSRYMIHAAPCCDVDLCVGGGKICKYALLTRIFCRGIVPRLNPVGVPFPQRENLIFYCLLCFLTMNIFLTPNLQELIIQPLTPLPNESHFPKPLTKRDVLVLFVFRAVFTRAGNTRPANMHIHTP